MITLLKKRLVPGWLTIIFMLTLFAFEADASQPAAPTNLVAIAGNNSVSLYWDDNTEGDLESYSVYRSPTSGSYGSALTNGLSSSDYVDSTAVNSNTYYYVVTAVDTNSNESANSSEVSATATNAPTVQPSVDWEQFLSRNDLMWTKMPREWYEGPFLGNGMMGTLVRQTDDKIVRWDVGRGDVQMHESGFYGVGRLPIGHFELHTVGTITGGDMRLSLWNAEASGTIRTDQGSIEWRSFVHSDLMVIVTEIEPSAGEQLCRWEWMPAVSITRGSAGNPPATNTTVGEVEVTIQSQLTGGEYVTAWQEINADGKRRLMTSVATTHPETTATPKAVAVIEQVREMSIESLLASHRAWWHDWYPTSFVSMPDPYWESFYWIQMYKLASGTRADRMLLDLNGPWLQPTPWPATWWNLNIQLTYWPTYASGRLGVGDSLCRKMYDNVTTLHQSVDGVDDSASIGRVSGQYLKAGHAGTPGSNGEPEVGNLLWACHNLWLHYRHTMDDDRLRNDLYPLLKRAVNYYLHFLEEGADGKLHLPRTFSPEYGAGPDTNYDLAILRWGCTALIEAIGRLEVDDPRLPEYENVLANLTDYPTDENGFMVNADTPFAKGHRHFSHLMMIYPFYLMNIEESQDVQDLVVTSVQHWISLGSLAGYSWTGASSLSSAMGMGNEALEYLNGLKPYVLPNTMYKESGPVIETPLAGAQSIHDMLIQSWDGIIRVFPAAPDAWGDLEFHNLRTEGAFNVSAKRKNGNTVFVRVKSLKGEPCIISPSIEGVIQVSGARAFNLQALGDGRYSLDLMQGEEAILWSGAEMPDLTISPLAADPANSNPFGLEISTVGAPEAPFNLTAAPSNNAVSLDWADNGEADLGSYSVYRSTTAGSFGAALATGLGTSDYMDNAVTNGTFYYYVVTATDTNGNESAQSIEVLAVPAEEGNAPPAFTSDTLVATNAMQGILYSADIADDASDPDSDPVIFTKIAGLAWLNIASDGSLSGTPGWTDIGTNTFTVQATAAGGSDTAQLRITVEVDPFTPPAAPTGVDAVAGDGYVALDWNDNGEGDLAGYSVFRSTTSGSGYSLITNNLSVSETLDSTAVNDTTYYYVVTATDTNSNESANSSEVFATPAEVEPPAGAIGWEAEEFVSEGGGGFDIGTDAKALGGEYIETASSAFSAPPNSTVTYTITEPTGGSGYNLYIRYIAPDGNSDSFFAPDAIGSNPNWTTITGVPELKNDFFWANVSADTPTPTYTLASGTNIFVFGGREAGFLVDAFVLSTNASLSAAELDAAVKKRNAPTGLPAPTGLTATASNALVTLDWSDHAESNVTYNVYRSTTSGSYGSALTNGLSSSDYVDNSAVNFTTYYYTVSVTGTNALESAKSSEVFATPADPSNQAPEFLSDPVVETNAMEGVAYSATLADNASDPESDPMTFSKESGPDWLSVASDGSLSGTPEWANTGTNSFAVQVTAAGGSDTATLEITVDADTTTPPAAPTGLTATAGNGSVSLSWNDNSEGDLDSYSVYRSTTPGSGYSEIANSLSLSETIDTSAVNGTTYYYVVTAVDTSINESANSSEVSATPTEATAPGAGTIGWQAEDFVSEGGVGFDTGTDASALGGEYITTSGGKYNEATATYSISASTAGSGYNLYMRYIAPNGNADSFFATDSMGASTTFTQINGLPNLETSFAWHNMTAELSQVPTYTLVSGANTFVFRGREAGFLVDAFVLSTDTDLSAAELDAAVLNEGPALSGYDQWATGWNTDIGSATNDLDGDGVSNLGEYALGGDPTNALVHGSVPTFAKSGNGFIYVHPMRSDDGTITYLVETTTNLVSGVWTNQGVVALGTNLTGGILNFVTNEVDTAEKDKFIRLKIQQ